MGNYTSIGDALGSVVPGVGNIIGAGVGALADTISSIFGGTSRRALTSNDWNTILPFPNGNYYQNLKQYLSSHIFYDTDLHNIGSYTIYFIVSSTPFANNHQAFFDELKNERIAQGMPYLNVNLSFSMIIDSDITPNDIDFVLNWKSYVYGTLADSVQNTGTYNNPYNLPDQNTTANKTNNTRKVQTASSNYILIFVIVGILVTLLLTVK